MTDFRTTKKFGSGSSSSDGYDIYLNRADGIDVPTAKDVNSLANSIAETQKALVDGYAYQTLQPTAFGMSANNQAMVYDTGTSKMTKKTVVTTDDANITINKSGTDASSVGAGIIVDRTGTKGSLLYDSSATSKFKVGDLASEAEIVTISHSQTLTSKTLTTPSISTPTLTADAYLNHITTPPNPPAGKLSIYAKADNKLYTKDSTGLETQIAGASAGIVPLGGIIAMTSGLHVNAFAIPSSGTASNGWQRADGYAVALGQTLTGATTPNLSSSIFLRGASTYGSTGGQNSVTLTTTELPAHTHTTTHSHANNFALGGTVTFPNASHTHGMDHVHQSAYNDSSNLYMPGSIAAGQVTSFTTGVSTPIIYENKSLNSAGLVIARSSTTGSYYTAKAVDSSGTVMTSTGAPSANTSTVTFSGSVIDFTGSTVSTGSGAAFDNQPNYIDVIYLIRVN